MDPTSESEALADRLEDQALSSARHSGGGKRGGGGRGGGGGKASEGGRGQREVSLSRALSRLLRHQAGNAGVELDREGFACLGEVVSTFFLFSFGWLLSGCCAAGGGERG
jgi:2'-phosphotransferase